MSLPQRTFRLLVQRVGDSCRHSFRVLACGEPGVHAHADFATHRALHDALDAAVPDLVLDLGSEGSIIFAGEMELDETQRRILGLA